ncbi:hypothetical protein F0U59_05270 [Archangium gephyra]|nr:hypothetical protein F0U59_05270 [Archangium gephyra]
MNRTFRWSLLLAGVVASGCGGSVDAAELTAPSLQTEALTSSQWTSNASMSIGRGTSHSSALLSSGLVLVTGGICGASCTTPTRTPGPPRAP